ncbi:hypothetical protein GLOTRDRAFT_136148 [Gloeophyllum trabeum ATCC 11539]|uniref:CCHC-type domain-containing protein n=1 Tax=Gloeophyllum trabeum (strain ATCC 11539 / FP-39264 / Madison 617) TaxID=670483 RepID=S7QIP7_GLOTA|nr:uncharacterized protein GLOTRDRAFT_136148 [Gloeophyllum trabeum ATCC 11539]EPQ59218.1 hypothetical protein GLOTRDRAFT_136148 [Gloeophyllum trabeum ATCC 11539]
MTDTEVIDLTAPSSPILVDEDSDGGPPSSSKPQPDATKDQKRKRKKKKRPVVDSAPEEGEVTSAPDNKAVSVAGDEGPPLFFVDLAPAPLSSASEPAPKVGESSKSAALEAASAQNEPAKLLLPDHVSVLSQGVGVPVEVITRPDEDSDDEAYIEYLDYDDRKAPGMVRYFEEEKEEPKQQKITCPQRFTIRGTQVNNYDDCDRCGSSRHHTNECPTLWRLYHYVSDADRETILRVREEKSVLGVGNGGEGYIATDEWCYNCGESGHLGDDCNSLPHPPDHPLEPSAFSSYNIMSGPFFDATTSLSKGKARRPRDWETSDHVGDGWGFNAPMNVGKQGRKKDRARMEQVAKHQEEEEDPDDWFGNPRNARNRGMTRDAQPPRNVRSEIGNENKVFTFGSMGNDRNRRFEIESSVNASRGSRYDKDRNDRYRGERAPDTFKSGLGGTTTTVLTVKSVETITVPGTKGGMPTNLY